MNTMSITAPPGSGLRFSMLGTFEVRDDAGPIDIGPHKQRLLLAALLCHPNTVVSVAQLTDAVWDETPPRTARKNIQAYMSTLRKVVGPRINHTGYGYVLQCTAAELDVIRFEEATARGRGAARSGATEDAAAAFAEALAQWRGPFLADVPRSAVLEAESVRLADRRLRACEDWAEAVGRLGDHRDVLDVVDALADAHPERERLTTAKLIALYQCGQRQEALAYYDFLRMSLSRDLGLDPSPNLQRLFRVMLAGGPIEPVAPRPEAAAPRPAPAAPVPAPAPQVVALRGDPLPADIADFTGREREIGRLVAGFGPSCDDTGVALITGPVGIGKTALAIHVAHLTTAHFRDGQLFVPMRDRHRRPRPLPDVLAGISAALGLDLGDTGTPDAASAWRAWLSLRHVLIVLDDARDESVIRGLLPGRGPSRMIVTSRFRLGGLENVRRVEPRDLSAPEAIELTAKVAGVGAVLDDRNEIGRHIARAGRSPLAVRILAGRVRQFGGPPIRSGGEILDQLVLGDLSVAARYRDHCDDLPARDLRVLAALAESGCPPYDRSAASARLSARPADTDRAIESLVDAHLLARPDDDVVAHAEFLEMPALAYDYVCRRIAADRDQAA
jgi:DNA-binding SARP family transcriptional activator